MATNGKTARELQAERLGDVEALLDLIGQELVRYREQAYPDFATAGTLGKVRSDLIETLAFVSGLAQADIEETLEDIRG